MNSLDSRLNLMDRCSLSLSFGLFERIAYLILSTSTGEEKDFQLFNEQF